MRYGTSAEVYALLAKKYDGTAYAVLPQVANGTGHKAGRWLDAVVASLWPSRGLWLHGFEIKVSRSDWLRELKQGEKADAFWEHLDYFSIVTHDRSIIHPGELPQGWGHYEADCVKKKLVCVREATPNAVHNGQIDRVFLMGLMRSIDGAMGTKLTEAQAREALGKEWKRGWDEGAQSVRREQEARQGQAEKNQVFLDAFAAAHGLSNYGMNVQRAERLGRLVRAFYTAEQHATDPFEALQTALETSVALLKTVREAQA